jgi:hypothetical protein
VEQTGRCNDDLLLAAAWHFQELAGINEIVYSCNTEPQRLSGLKFELFQGSN